MARGDNVNIHQIVSGQRRPDQIGFIQIHAPDAQSGIQPMQGHLWRCQASKIKYHPTNVTSEDHLQIIPRASNLQHGAFDFHPTPCILAANDFLQLGDDRRRSHLLVQHAHGGDLDPRFIRPLVWSGPARYASDLNFAIGQGEGASQPIVCQNRFAVLLQIGVRG